jgi:uncharacterized RDD family membrane protein YckC
MLNRALTPLTPSTAPAEELEYVGFWARVGASLIDTVLVLLLIVPLYSAFVGSPLDLEPPSGSAEATANILISYVGPAVAVILFWIARQATPGKMAIHARIVDARTGQPLSVRQALVRYVGYFVSTVPLCLGLLWVAFDTRKQGWHDKMAGTVVVRVRHRTPAPVSFKNG